MWHIERLARAGITDLIINHAHLGDRIEAALGDGSQFGACIRYSDEETALETAGGIAFALPLLGEEPFAVINADIWCDYDFAQLPRRAAVLADSGDLAHIVLVDNPEHHPRGDFALKDSRLLPESRILNPESGLLTFSGIGIYRPSLFAGITRGSKAPLAPLLREQIALGKVGGEHHRGLWMDIGTPQRLAELDKQLRTTQNTAHD